MIESVFRLLLLASAVHVVAGLATAAWFFARRIRHLDPPAAGGSTGFLIVIAPGVVALWPLVLIKELRPRKDDAPDRAEELRRHHRVAILVLTVAASLVLAAALVWRAPAFKSLPESGTITP